MDKIEVTEEQRGLIAQGKARWVERWYGSDPMKGSAIVTEDRSEIAVLGGDEETHKQVRKVVMVHNAGIKALATRTDATPVAWMPIESAPKDGTVVLFATPEPGDWRYHMSRADDRWNGAYWLNKATHWMHLPAAPRGE